MYKKAFTVYLFVLNRGSFFYQKSIFLLRPWAPSDINLKTILPPAHVSRTTSKARKEALIDRETDDVTTSCKLRET